jgi:hypothetical protein
MIESVDSLRLKTKAEFIQILRWEDDGGAVFDVDPPFPQVVGTSTPRPRNVATDDLFYAELKKEIITQKETKNEPIYIFHGFDCRS